MIQSYNEIEFKNKTGIDFSKFYTANKTKLNWHLTKFNIDRETAEDYVDEAFLQCLNKIDTYNPDKKSQPHTWLFRIAENLVIKAWRDATKLNLLPLDKELNNEDFHNTYYDIVPYEMNEDETERNNSLECKKKMIYDTIHELPPIYQDILNMREIENMQYKEISESILQDFDINEFGTIYQLKEPSGFKSMQFKNVGYSQVFVRYYVLNSSELELELFQEDIVEPGWEYEYEEFFYKFSRIEIDSAHSHVTGKYTSFMNLSTVKSRIFHARDKVIAKLQKKFAYIDKHGVDFIPLVVR